MASMNDPGGMTMGTMRSHGLLFSQGLMQQVALQVVTKVFLGTLQLHGAELCKRAKQCEEGAIVHDEASILNT